jgi:hypothetical protein
MATINVVFDTKEKTLDVTMDGKKMKNVTGVDFMARYDEKDKFYAEIRSEDPNKDDDIIVVTRVIANKEIEVEEIPKPKCGDDNREIYENMAKALLKRKRVKMV